MFHHEMTSFLCIRLNAQTPLTIMASYKSFVMGSSAPDSQITHPIPFFFPSSSKLCEEASLVKGARSSKVRLRVQSGV